MGGGMNIKGSTISIVGGVNIRTSGNKVIINDKTYNKPGRGNTQSIINGKIFINGYEFKNGEFKRTFLSIWHYIF